MEVDEILSSENKDNDCVQVNGNLASNHHDSSTGIHNSVVINDVNELIETDRMSNDSPMFNDPSPQEHILASSSSSEDALKSLEKLENLARLAENAALEDRDVETPQSFVNAEDENDDVGVADDVVNMDENGGKKDLTPEFENITVDEQCVAKSGFSEDVADKHETDQRSQDLAEKVITEPQLQPVDESASENPIIDHTEEEADGESTLVTVVVETDDSLNCEDKEAQETSFQEGSSVAGEGEGQLEDGGKERIHDSNRRNSEGNPNSIEVASCEQKPEQEQQPKEQSQTSTNTSVSMATSNIDSIRPASPIHGADDEEPVELGNNQKMETSPPPENIPSKDSQKDEDDAIQSEDVQTPVVEESERDTESPIQVSDPLPSQESLSLSGKRPIIIEDEQTGSVTVSYGDELVRVELNDSSGDEFSDVEETEEQRILRESGAQIIEDDDDDEEEEEIQRVNIQLENTTRKSVIHSPIERNNGESEKTVEMMQNSSEKTPLPPPQTNKDETSSKSKNSAQRRKESKLEQSIRKISNIREKENSSETVQVESIGTVSNVVQHGNKTDMTLVVTHNVKSKDTPSSVCVDREAASTVIESDSESEMVIDERSESERNKQQRKDAAAKKRNRQRVSDSSGDVRAGGMKILGTVQIIENDSTELCTVQENDDVSRTKSSQAKEPGSVSGGPITIEPSATLPAPPPLIPDDVVITSVKPNADTTAFKPILQIKQEKEDNDYGQYQQFVKQPPPPPPYRPPFPMGQRAPIGINLSTGRAVGGGMMRGPPMSQAPYHRHPTPPAYAAPRPLKIGMRHGVPNTSQYNNPLHGMSNIVMNQGGQQRMSQALINVVMPGSSITAGPRFGGGPQQPNMRMMGPTSFASTTSVPVQIVNPPTTSANIQSKTVTVVIPPKGSTTNTSPATHNKIVSSVNTSSVGGSKKTTNVKVTSAANTNVGFIKKLSLELPTYSPPKPPEKLALNSIPQHTCAGCQDKFTSKSSLDWHRARQSMLLTFTCRRCQKHITFSNKCALLSHISSHGLFYQAVEKALSEGNLIIKPLHSAKNGKSVSLPVPTSISGAGTSSQSKAKSNQLNGTEPKKNANPTTTNVIGIDAELDKLIQKSKEIKQSSQQKAPTPQSKSPKPVISNVTSQAVDKSDELTPKRKEVKILPKPTTTPSSAVKVSVDHAQLQCAECGKHVPHHAALKAHFNTPSPEQKQVAACRNKMCNMVLPTLCARDAHERYTHFQASKPHVCPECGIECGANIKVFRKHLSQICFHLCRIMVYCCPKCSFLTKFAEQIVEHAVDAHGEKYHKCLQCPMAFKSRSTFVGHCKNAHNYDDDGDPDAILPPHKLIFKCPMCDTVFHKYKQLQDHLGQHYPDTKKVQRLGFKCPRCDTLLRGNKSQLMEHLKTSHKVTDFVTHMCHICGRVFGSDNEKNIHIIQTHPDIVSGTQTTTSSDNSEQEKAKTETKREEADKKVEKPVVKEKIPTAKAPVYKPGPACSKKRAISPASSVGSASSAGSKPPKRRPSPVKELVTGSRNSGQRTLCNRCGIRFESDVDYTKHMRIHESRKRAVTDNKKSAAVLKKPKLETPDETQIAKKVQVELKEEPPRVPCTDCDKHFKTEQEREKHMQSEHAHVPQFPCHLCGLTYLVQSQLDSHVKTVHEGKSKDSVYACWVCLENNVHKSYQKRALLESHLKSVHKIPRNQIDFSKIPDISSCSACDDSGEGASKSSSPRASTEGSVVKRLRQDGDEEFTCAKCNFVCTERDEFQTHIAKHKSVEEDALQCHECGMSFMVLPSLKRHLFMVHKIRNLKRYQEESGVNLQSPSEQLAAMRPSRLSRSTGLQNGYSSRESDSTRDSDTEHDANVLECTVCYKEFENQSQLRKHMRMHGMAFIRSRRLDPALS